MSIMQWTPCLCSDLSKNLFFYNLIIIQLYFWTIKLFNVMFEVSKVAQSTGQKLTYTPFFKNLNFVKIH